MSREKHEKCVLKVVSGHRLIPLGGGIPRPRLALARKGGKVAISDERYETSLKDDEPRIIVARPRAVPIPLPLIAFTPVRLNLCKHKGWSARAKSEWEVAGGTDIGAFCNISGTMKNLTILPLM